MAPPAAAKWQVRTYLLQAGQPPKVITTKLKYEDAPEVDESGSTGCNAADLNGDGLLDLMLGHSNGMVVFENQGGGNWLPNTEAYVPSLNAYSWAMAAGDLDHEPGVEVYVGAGALPNASVLCDFVPPCSVGCDFECSWNKLPLQNVTTNDLILRRMTGILMKDVTSSYPQVPQGGFATTPAMVDIDRDGWLDVAVGNDFGHHFLLKNEKGLLVKHDTDVGFRPYAHLMGWGIGDFDRDGLTDLAIADTWDTRRSFMPVRDVIHSSDVSRNVARSSLVRTAGGNPSPQPVMAAYGIGRFYANADRRMLSADGNCGLRLRRRARRGSAGRADFGVLNSGLKSELSTPN